MIVIKLRPSIGIYAIVQKWSDFAQISPNQNQTRQEADPADPGDEIDEQ